MLFNFTGNYNYTPYEIELMKYTSFNAGFGSNQISKNITPCDHLYLLHEYFEKPTFATKKKYSTLGENILNTTSFLANSTNYLFACTYAV
jgi:mannose-1-phosphate guanylyltransferase